MFQKLLTSCHYLQNKINYAAAFAFCALTCLCGTIFAAGDPQPITITDSNINWTELPSKLMTALVTPIVVGIGIALSVWAIFAAVKFFKKSAR